MSRGGMYEGNISSRIFKTDFMPLSGLDATPSGGGFNRACTRATGSDGFVLPVLNPAQKGFLVRIGMLGGILVGGLILKLIAEGLITSMETTVDMDIFSWIGLFSGVVFSIVTPVMAIVTLRYGRRHEAGIREHVGLSRLLTIYRILFWLTIVFVLLVAAGLIWLGTYLGPVR